MASSQTSAKHGTCDIKQALIESLERTHAALMLLSNREIEAVTRGDLVADETVTAERNTILEHRESVIKQLREHRAEHGC